MKRKMFLSLFAAIMTICGVVVLTGCKHDYLAEKVAKMQNHLKAVSSQSDESHYFG